MKPIPPYPLINHRNILNASRCRGIFYAVRKFYFKIQASKWNKSQKTITTKSLCIYQYIITAHFVRNEDHFVPKQGNLFPQKNNFTHR